MFDVGWITALVFLVDLLIRLGLSVRVIMRRLPVGVSLAWLFVVLVFPFIGIVVYLLIGELRLGHRRGRKAELLHDPYEEWLAELKSRGVALLYTTHYMEEAQELADRVAIISRGRIVAEGTPAELTSRAGGTRISFRSPANGALPEEIAAIPAGDDRLVVETIEPTRVLHVLTDWAMVNGIELQELSVNRNTLEDVYFALTADPQPEEPK